MGVGQILLPPRGREGLFECPGNCPVLWVWLRDGLRYRMWLRSFFGLSCKLLFVLKPFFSNIGFAIFNRINHIPNFDFSINISNNSNAISCLGTALSRPLCCSQADCLLHCMNMCMSLYTEVMWEHIYI